MLLESVTDVSVSTVTFEAAEVPIAHARTAAQSRVPKMRTLRRPRESVLYVPMRAPTRDTTEAIRLESVYMGVGRETWMSSAWAVEEWE